MNLANEMSRILTLADIAWRPDDNEMIDVNFDDYEWTDLPDPIDRPKIAIDYFRQLFNKDINLIYSAYQVAIEKRGT